MESGENWKISASIISTLGFGTLLGLLFKGMIAIKKKEQDK